MYIYTYIHILTQSFWTGTKVIRRKHIVQPTGFGACSSTCCQWDGEDVPAPWERSNSHPPVRVQKPMMARLTEAYMRSASVWVTGFLHYNDVILGVMASQITSLTIVYSTVYSGADQRKYQSSASLAFVRGIHRGPVNSPHKWPVTRKMFPFDDVIMVNHNHALRYCWEWIWRALQKRIGVLESKSS